MGASREKEASSSSCSIQSKFTYDIFLSFCGLDTRKNFTSHLLAALEQHGFHTFRDDTKLNPGENISYELLKAIEESRISLVIFSKNYAASRWCLDELVQIMECRKTLQQIVLPIFHDVKPSDVRGQKGSLAKAFAEHRKKYTKDRVQKWRNSLTDIADLSGWDGPEVANGDEAQLIRKVVGKVQNKLDLPHLHVACHEIGLGSRLQELKMLLNMESHHVHIIAIWGMGGIGKTTIAKKLHNLIQLEFEGSSFLANIREASKHLNGLVVLQEQLLSDIFGTGAEKLGNIDHGIEVIKRRTTSCRVLLILDDVDNFRQLQAFAINRRHFGFGSRIIITTRDISSLNSLKVDGTYAIEEMNEDESLELFKWCCFGEDRPTEDHLDLSSQVVRYAGGLPLALEVLGAYLCDKTLSEWKSAISKLEKIPNADIQAKLMISLESLSEEVKQLFLDIACFFVGTDRDFTVKILECCKRFAENGIRDLVNRCLVKYHCGKIVMHDLLREMGRDIVRQGSVEEPGKRSRLWYHEDALEVLADGTGTEAVEGLFLNFHGCSEVQINPNAFAKMNRLWLLHLNYVYPGEGYDHISKRLLWLCWNGFPLQCLPSNLHMENLVTLDLRYSSLEKLWEGKKILAKLKFLYLSHCYHLIETPDFFGLCNLEELLLNDCTSLVEVDDSIKFLNKLVILDINNCKKLQKLPSSILTLKSLNRLDLSCSLLGKFSGFKGSQSKSPNLCFSSHQPFERLKVDSIAKPVPIRGPTTLKSLWMKNCGRSCLPTEVGNLTSLEILVVSHNPLEYLPDSLCGLAASLDSLDLNNRNLSHPPSQFKMLSSLTDLYLERNNVRCLPNGFSELASLKNLQLSECERLQSLPQLPVNLQRVDASYCTSLESITTEFNWQAGLSMFLLGCDMIAKNNFANNVMERIEHSVSAGKKTWDGSEDAELDGITIIYLPGAEVPNWFRSQYTGSKLSLVVPPLVTRRILGWSLCIVFRTQRNHGQGYVISVVCYKPALPSLPVSVRYHDQDQMLLFYFPSDSPGIHGGDKLEIEINPEPWKAVPWLTVKKCGINLIYGNDEEIETVREEENPDKKEKRKARERRKSRETRKAREREKRKSTETGDLD